MSVILAAAWLAATPAATPDTLDAITVSASRRAQPVREALASVSVIERAQIDRSQASDLLELLRREVGLDFARTGGTGQTTSLFLRGTNSNHLLVLIDGIRVASSNTGAVALEHLPLAQIERIEIVRGPRASYWGSDAIGGVLAITTRQPEGPEAALRVGSEGRLGLSAGWGVRQADGHFSLTVGGEDYDGFSAQTPDGFAYDPDDDGYRRRHLSLHAGRQLGSQQLSLSVLALRAETEFDQGVSDAEQHSLALSLEGPLGEGWQHRLSLGGNRDDLDTPVFFNRFLSRRQQLDWVHDVRLGGSEQLLAGVQLQREKGSSVDTFGQVNQYAEQLDHAAVFTALQGRNGAFDHELALRYDDHERFGGELSSQLAVGWRFDPGRLYLSFGEGFRAPNLNELYSPGFGGLFAGNPNLGPESSRSLELGLDTDLAGTALALNIYRTRVNDLIAFEGGQSFQAVNIAEAAVDGAELTLSRRFETLSVAANATWQDARNAATDAELLRRPRRKLALDLDYDLSANAHVGADLAYVSQRQDIAGELASYSLLGLRAETRLGDDWHLGARINNALDREYAWAAGFGAPGREWLVTLRWQAP